MSFPGERGPVPELSEAFVRLFPDVSVRGGSPHFAHDRGLMTGPPEWLVGDQQVDTRDSNIINAICQHRKIAADAAQVAQVAFDFTVHQPNRLEEPLFEEPSDWSECDELAEADAQFAPPSFELVPHPDQADVQVCRVTFWHRSEEQTENPDFVFCPYQRREIPNKNRLRDDEIKHWTVWARHQVTLLASPLRSGSHYSEKIGHIIDSDDVESIESSKK
jgi:hypothetical protein